MSEFGTLYLCATPIGNLEDITLRTVRVLGDVACIYAEDTRHSSLLLKHLGISCQLLSCHEHNEATRAQEIVERLQCGDNLAFISDAGLPGISDPGVRLVRACIDNGLPYTVLPGASAGVTALVLSGLCTEKFVFLGFLPRQGKERKGLIEKIVNSEYTTIIYESPNRVADTLCQVAQHTPDRETVLVREITKFYEQVLRGTCKALSEQLLETPVKGECVLLFSGKPDEVCDLNALDEEIKKLLSHGISAKDVSKQLSMCYNIGKNEVYRRAIGLGEQL